MTDATTDETLDRWTESLAAALGIPADAIDRDAVLGLAGTVAHAIVRPAAPITTYLVGYAAGRDAGRSDAFAAAAATARALARANNDKNAGDTEPPSA